MSYEHETMSDKTLASMITILNERITYYTAEQFSKVFFAKLVEDTTAELASAQTEQAARAREVLLAEECAVFKARISRLHREIDTLQDAAVILQMLDAPHNFETQVARLHEELKATQVEAIKTAYQLRDLRDARKAAS